MDGTGTVGSEADLRLIYAEAFAEAPYLKSGDDVAANFRRFARQVRRPGFRAVVGYGDDGEPVGMAYGFPLGASTGWWDVVQPPVTEEMRREDGRRTFGLMELAVRAPWRRRGVGRHVHDLVVEGLEERVILNARPDAEAAQAAYRSWGYRRVGRGNPWDGAVLHDILVLTRGR
ncbi:N-acetyltransferase family protein [Yinghuangia sp. YIM S10712]|uniref:GNAT family N-acetyltransferase n=1 Tax=Yinghuangia sp. YIM S10712 TaxID=3436930 RepID=UPI003F52CD7A